MKANHITERQKELYLKYLLKEDLKQLDWEEMLEIESHLADCDKCSEEVHEQYEDIQFIENWSFKLDNQLFEQDKIVKLLLMNKKKTNNEKISQKLDAMLNNIDKINQYGLTIMMKAEKLGRRIFSRIALTTENTTFQYALTATGERSDGGQKNIVNIKKVQISNTIKNKVQVELSDDEKSVTVTIKAKKEAVLRELVLLTTNEQGEIQIQPPVYNEEKKVYEYHFEGLDAGKYFLFVDPGIIG